MSLQQPSPLLVVVSQLDGKGPTGVEAHFNQILALAGSAGAEALLVSSENAKPLRFRLLSAVHRLLPGRSTAQGIAWGRFWKRAFLRWQLRRVLKGAADRRVVFYAQDPLSAVAALSVYNPVHQRVALTVHYNVSEVEELVAKGTLQATDAICQEILDDERLALRQANKVFFVSRFMHDMILNRLPGLEFREHEVIPNFPQPPTQAVTPSVQADLIAIGTLEPRKNQHFLLEVLVECARRGVRLTLTLAGSGPDLEALKSFATANGIVEQVNFLGAYPGAARLIPAHRLLVHAARVENMPITLMESFSYGVPVIAARAGGIPEIIDEGVNGVFWSVDDVSHAADILIRTVGDAEGLARLSQAARQKYLNEFSHDVLASRWLHALLD